MGEHELLRIMKTGQSLDRYVIRAELDKFLNQEDPARCGAIFFCYLPELTPEEAVKLVYQYHRREHQPDPTAFQPGWEHTALLNDLTHKFVAYATESALLNANPGEAAAELVPLSAKLRELEARFQPINEVYGQVSTEYDAESRRRGEARGVSRKLQQRYKEAWAAYQPLERELVQQRQHAAWLERVVKFHQRGEAEQARQAREKRAREYQGLVAQDYFANAYKALVNPRQVTPQTSFPRGIEARIAQIEAQISKLASQGGSPNILEEIEKLKRQIAGLHAGGAYVPEGDHHEGDFDAPREFGQGTLEL